MKRLLLAASLSFCAAAYADPLADADLLFAKKSYPQALQAYTKLANAGHPEAQQHLGQMYWYGEAGAVDEAKAQLWFEKAAGKGDKVAAASLAIMKQRGERRAEIDHWVSRYDGADLKSGKFHCPVPRIPPISKQTAEIERVSNAIAKWQDCYNGFVNNLNAASPLSERIPADIAKLMNASEMERAKKHLAQVQENLAQEAKVGAKLVLADVGVWRSATEAYVGEHNAIIQKMPKDDSIRSK